MVAKVALPFAAWEPDKSSTSGAAADAKGVVSNNGRWQPDRELAPLISGAAMNDTALGAGGFYTSNGGVRIFLGDATKLYDIQARVPVDVSKIGGYNVNPDWAWTFAQFGTSIYATARGLPQIQRYEVGVSTKFGDVSGGPGLSDTLFRVREFLFSGLGTELRNSCFNDPLDWNPASTTGIQAAINYLPSSGGDVVIGTGGQFGLVFQERKIHRLTYTGGTTAPFQRDEIEDKRGAVGPNAISRYGFLTFFASEDGIRVTDGSAESQGIGEGKIDRYFTSNLNYSQRHRVSMSVDVERRILRVAFPTGGNSYCNTLLTYSMQDGRWSYDDINVDLLFEAPRQGVTVDDTAAIRAIAGTTLVDSITAPVDSPIWRETRKQIMAVNAGHQVCTFDGQTRPASIETGYGEVMPGHMGFLTEVWPLVDADTVNAVVTTKLRKLSDAPAEGTLTAMNAYGFCPVLAHARWMKAKVAVPGGVNWSEAVGIEWDARAAGGH